MKNPKARNRFLLGLAFVVAITAVMLLPWLGFTFFNSKGEPREAIVAVSILESGDWILPVSYGGDIPYKPPFMAWIIALIAQIFNHGTVTEYISRLPSALAAIGLASACYVEGFRVRNARFGVLFALVVITCAEIFRSSTTCRLDMVLTVCIVGAIFFLYHAVDGSESGLKRCIYFFGGWAMMTCATLTKGPVGIVLPCAVIFFYILCRRKSFGKNLAFLCIVGIASVGIPLWWYYAAYSTGGQEFLDLALEENIGRFTGTMSYDSHVKPLWYNFATLALGLLPWTLFLLYKAVKESGRTKSLLNYDNFRTAVTNYFRSLSPFALMCWIGAVVIFVFYSIPSSKRSVYLLPMYPLVCYGIANLLWTYRKKAMRASLVFIGLYIIYSALIAPLVLNPKSDIHILPKIEKRMKGTDSLLSYGHDKSERLFTLNYYLNDGLRPLENPDSIPQGATILLVNPEDTTVFQQKGYRTSLLTKRGCDHRKAIYIAQKP